MVQSALFSSVKPSAKLTKKYHEHITMPVWLFRLRWLALAIQTLNAVFYLYSDFTWVKAAVILSASLMGSASEVYLNGLKSELKEKKLPLFLLMDCFLHTALLAVSGGITNPFTVLFLTHVVISALALKLQWTISIILFSCVCFGALLAGTDLKHHGHHGHSDFASHLFGMWIAYVCSAGMIGYAIYQVMKDLSTQQLKIKRLESINDRQSKLASLASLTAGAAHELSTPLGTISIIIGELKRQLQTNLSAIADLDSAQSEVLRCRKVLEKMQLKGGSLLNDELENINSDTLYEKIKSEFLDDSNVTVINKLKDENLFIQCDNFMAMLHSFVKNSKQAQQIPGDKIEIILDKNSDFWCLKVIDSGKGIPAKFIENVCDPFFTSKDPGQGMGLGLFLASTYVNEMQGELNIKSVENEGTIVLVQFPLKSNLKAA